MAEFEWTRPAAGAQTDEEGKATGLEIAAMLHDAAVDWVSELFGATDPTLLSTLVVRPILRSISATFQSPLAAGEPVFVGATLGHLSVRSFALVTGVWAADDRRLIAGGTASFVVVDTGTGKATAVPDIVADTLRRTRPDLAEFQSGPGNGA
jgi:acyl-CoA thioesterase FadM